MTYYEIIVTCIRCGNDVLQMTYDADTIAENHLNIPKNCPFCEVNA